MSCGGGWSMDRRCCICRSLLDGEGLCGSCSCGCSVDCVWVYGAGKPSAHQRSSATNICLHVCSTLWSVWNDRLKPFHVTSTAVHSLTSGVCVCVCECVCLFVNGRQMTAFLFLIRKCVSCEAVGDSLWLCQLSNQATQSHTVVFRCVISQEWMWNTGPRSARDL